MSSAKTKAAVLVENEHEDSISRTLASFQEQDRLRIALSASANAAQRSRVAPSEEDGASAEFMTLTLEGESEEEGTVTEVSSVEGEAAEEAIVLPEDHAFKALPIENCEKIMLFVGEDYFPVCARVSHSFAMILSSESLWKSLCLAHFVQPAYMPTRLNSLGKPLRAASWKALAKKRSRLRYGGVYVSRHVYIRDPGPRTMWSPATYEPYVEVKHFRYLFFLKDGTVIYASTPLETSKMIPYFRNYILTSNQPRGDLLELPQATLNMDHRPGNSNATQREKVKRLYFGEYIVRGGKTIVKVDMGNYTVKFTLEIATRHHILDPVEFLPHNTLITRSHESLYHAVHERVIQYPLAEFESDRVWKYRPVFH